MDIVVGLFQGAIAYAIPLWLASMGELVQQRSGTWGLGIEGSMLAGAFAGYFVVLKSSSLTVGVLSGLLIGTITGLLTAYFIVILGQNQVLVGIGLNTLMAGLTSFLFVEQVANVYNKVPYINVMPIARIPVLRQIPILGPAFFETSLLSYGVYLLFPILAIILGKTSIGLKNRAVGESAEKCNALGINVIRIRVLSSVFAHALAGLAGSILVLGSTAAFTHGMTSGRGFLAVAIVIVSNWTLLGVAVIGFLFGITQSGQQILQIITPEIPWQLLLAFPYIFGIAALMVGALKARQPSELGVPFLRQK